jgi:hypothetical protein
VEVLVAEGELVWIDRPGTSPDSFGFDQAYVDSHDIDYLQSGRSWSDSIQTALTASGAVIGCLSRALQDQREVLQDELSFADISQKLVTCVVDDLPFSELSRLNHGLLDVSRCQSVRIDPCVLRRALDVREASGCAVEDLPSPLRLEWEKVRSLIAAANKVRIEPRPLRAADIARIAPLLATIPVGPILRVTDIPAQIVEALGLKVASAERVETAFNQAATLIMAAFPHGFTERQIVLRKAALPPFGTLPGEAYWTQLLAAAGLKARRMVAAFLLCPVNRWAIESAGIQVVADQFVNSLRTVRN